MDDLDGDLEDSNAFASFLGASPEYTTRRLNHLAISWPATSEVFGNLDPSVLRVLCVESIFETPGVWAYLGRLMPNLERFRVAYVEETAEQIGDCSHAFMFVLKRATQLHTLELGIVPGLTPQDIFQICLFLPKLTTLKFVMWRAVDKFRADFGQELARLRPSLVLV
jgi:hypothetical protein